MSYLSLRDYSMILVMSTVATAPISTFAAKSPLTISLPTFSLDYWSATYYLDSLSNPGTLERVVVVGRRSGVSCSADTFVCRRILENISDPYLTQPQLRNLGVPEPYIAAIDKKQDIRCAPISPDQRNTTSLDDDDKRKAAVQAAFDSTFQRTKIAESTWQLIVFGVYIRLGLEGRYTFTATYADGGTEDYLVQNLTSSINLTQKSETRKRSDGVVRAINCSTAG